MARTGEPVRIEDRAEGLGRWYNIYAFRIGDADSRSVAALFSDISDRRRVETALRESESRQAFLLALSDTLRPLADPAAIQGEAARLLRERFDVGWSYYAEFDARGEMASVLRDATRAGLPSIAGRHDMSDVPEYMAFLRTGQLLNVSDYGSYELLPRRFTQRYTAMGVHAMLGVALLKQGQLLAQLVMLDTRPREWPQEAVDLITEVAERTWAAVERARSEAALRDSEMRYRSLFGSIEQGFCILQVILDDNGRGVDYRFLEVNPAFERHTGLVNAVGKTALELLPDLEPRWAEIYGRVATTGQRERFVSQSEPMARWFEVDAFRIGDAADRKVALLFSDITERTLTAERLKEADRRKDEFLAVLGHELRNPLAPIRTGLDLLDQVRKMPALLDSLRPMMDRQLSHLIRLVDDLLDMSRINRGSIELRRAPLDLNHAVEAAIEQVHALMSERRHELVAELAPNPLPLQGDFERLTQVIANVLSNAGKYTEPGGEIRVSTALEQGQALVRVLDNGFGIPPERLDAIFEMFVRVPEHRALNGGSGGLGIGLALSRKLVEMHQGSIEARSLGLGRGSEFIVRLPADCAAPAVAQAPQSQAAPQPARRILVVDDNVDAAESLGMLLAFHGHQVEIVHDGPDAMQRLERFAAQVVLLDIGLPGWDGIEVARRIRAKPTGGDLLLVAVTGWGQEADRRRTQEAGFDYHLTKPVALEELLGLIQNGSPQPAG